MESFLGKAEVLGSSPSRGTIGTQSNSKLWVPTISEEPQS